MFISEGKITIKAIHGARGRFCVGDLVVPEGELKVKDAVLDQFEPGTYSGKFDIAAVAVQSYTHFGRVVTELRARLNAIYMDGAGETGEGDAAPPPAEPDPAEDDPAPAAAAPAPSTAETQAAAAGSEQAPSPPAEGSAAGPAVVETEFMSEAERAHVATLGQEVYALVLTRAAVKLDPTVGRVQLRAQAAALKSLGYRFDGQSQTWHATAA